MRLLPEVAVWHYRFSVVGINIGPAMNAPAAKQLERRCGSRELDDPLFARLPQGARLDPLGFVEDDDTLRPNHLNLFTELQPDERDTFLSRCTRQHFNSGVDIFSQGEPYTKSYVIRSGVVRTYYVAPSGKEITIAYWPEGTLIGGPNVFKERRSHIWSAQAVTEVVAEQIRGQDLEELTMKIPRLAYYLIETLTFKLHWVSVLLQAFGTQSVRARVAYLLLQLGKRYGVASAEGTLIAHHFSHDELGRMVGATRCWVTLALKELKREGIISTRGRDISILSMKALKAKAEGGTSELADP